MKVEKEKWLDQLKAVSLIGIPLIYLFSFIKLYLYYKWYNIDITKFIELSELVTLYLADVALMFVVAASIYILLKWLDPAKLSFAAIIAATGIYITYKWSFDGDITWSAAIISLISFPLLMTVVYQLQQYIISQKISTSLNFVLVYLSIYFFCQTLGVGYTILSNNEYSNYIKFKAEDLDGNIIESGSASFLIGSTRSFIFFYREADKQTEVIPLNSLKYFTYGEDLRPRTSPGQGPPDEDPDPDGTYTQKPPHRP